MSSHHTISYDALLAVFRERIEQDGGAKTAAKLGISQQHLSDVKNGHRPLRKKIAAGMGYVEERRYRKVQP